MENKSSQLSYYYKNRESILAKSKGRYKERQRKYYLANREKILKKAKLYQKNLDPIKVKNDQRIRDRKRKYKISDKEYNELIVKQDYKCSICNIDSRDLKKDLCVDHCHSQNKIRGLLCNRCNLAIGLFDDNIELLKKAIIYLQINK
jgi:hypothetical protein